MVREQKPSKFISHCPLRRRKTRKISTSYQVNLMHISCRKNVIHERAKFYRRTQRHGELIEKFVRGLSELTENCDFLQKNHQIRDCLVIGLKTKELSEKRQLREDLSLGKVVEIARRYEQVKTQIEEMQDNSVDAVKEERKETTKRFGWKKVLLQKETCNFCLARNLIWPLESPNIFTQSGWPVLFSPNHIS